MIAIRPVLPLVNYAINYNYIVKNLCENRNMPQSTCHGKCYVEKELAKAEKESNNSQNVKLSGLDFFISKDIFTLTNRISEILIQSINIAYFCFRSFDYCSEIFHPPLALNHIFNTTF